MGKGPKKRWVAELPGEYGVELLVRLSADAGERVSWVDFEAFEAMGYDPVTRGALYSGEVVPTLDVDKATPLFSGYLKWDGCNHIDFGQGCAHRCGLDDRETLHRFIRLALHTAASLMPEAWDFGPPPDSPLHVREV